MHATFYRSEHPIKVKHERKLNEKRNRSTERLRKRLCMYVDRIEIMRMDVARIEILHAYGVNS